MKKGLGRGLDALFESYGAEPKTDGEKTGIKMLKITDIDPNPYQPRKSFDEGKIQELAESIKQHGVVQPIAVKKQGDRYMIIAGERRWRAARAAGLTEIPAVTMDLSEREIIEVALIENLQREDLNPIEEAQGIKLLIEQYKLTQEEVAERLGRSRPAIANTLRLLNLSPQIQDHLVNGRLTEGHARALLGISDLKLRDQVAQRIIEKGLSVRDTEQLIKKITGYQKAKKKTKAEKPVYLMELEMNLEEALGTRVQITPGKKKGIIEIEYYGDDDLERILEKLTAKN
ncbi:MAG TPA: ParB/RepB/Spo0J family partition protein [Candidatus Atribacteria bacterium]|nr:ParB/RepB/Spo0J family partition protein [Candidatus Atribacteria bacterium]HPT78694.1 ParB/RepB/Spo0J family partition protein [Candidatus Atribacteria bacterium]